MTAGEGRSNARQPRGLWAAGSEGEPSARGLCDEGGTLVRLQMKPDTGAHLVSGDTRLWQSAAWLGAGTWGRWWGTAHSPERRSKSGGVNVPKAGAPCPTFKVPGGCESQATPSNPPHSCVLGNSPGANENITGLVEGPRNKSGSVRGQRVYLRSGLGEAPRHRGLAPLLPRHTALPRHPLAVQKSCLAPAIAPRSSKYRERRRESMTFLLKTGPGNESLSCSHPPART